MIDSSKFVVALVASASSASAFMVSSSAFGQTNQRRLATVETVNLSAPPLAPFMDVCASIAPKEDVASSIAPAKFLKDFTKPMAIPQVRQTCLFRSLILSGSLLTQERSLRRMGPSEAQMHLEEATAAITA
jgi:hypothetical protein